MPEQLAFDELLGNGGAVHLDERLIPPLAVEVQQVGDQLLAGAVFPADEDAPVRGGGELDLLAQRLHGHGVADHDVLLFHLLAQQPVLLLEVALMQGVLYHQQSLLERQRLSR